LTLRYRTASIGAPVRLLAAEWYVSDGSSDAGAWPLNELDNSPTNSSARRGARCEDIRCVTTSIATGET